MKNKKEIWLIRFRSLTISITIRECINRREEKTVNSVRVKIRKIKKQKINWKFRVRRVSVSGWLVGVFGSQYNSLLFDVVVVLIVSGYNYKFNHLWWSYHKSDGTTTTRITIIRLKRIYCVRRQVNMAIRDVRFVFFSLSLFQSIHFQFFPFFQSIFLLISVRVDFQMINDCHDWRVVVFCFSEFFVVRFGELIKGRAHEISHCINFDFLACLTFNEMKFEWILNLRVEVGVRRVGGGGRGASERAR